MIRWQRFWWAFAHAWRFSKVQGEITRQQARNLERQMIRSLNALRPR